MGPRVAIRSHGGSKTALWLEGTRMWHLDHIVAQKTCYERLVLRASVPREEQVLEVTPSRCRVLATKRNLRRKAALIDAVRRGRNLGRIK
jgi:hypothetical protein